MHQLQRSRSCRRRRHFLRQFSLPPPFGPFQLQRVSSGEADHPNSFPLLRSSICDSPDLHCSYDHHRRLAFPRWYFYHFPASCQPGTTDNHPKRLPIAEAKLLRPSSTTTMAVIAAGDVVIAAGDFAHFLAIFWPPTVGLRQ